jgi:hypothetical protein
MSLKTVNVLVYFNRREATVDPVAGGTVVDCGYDHRR